MYLLDADTDEEQELTEQVDTKPRNKRLSQELECYGLCDSCTFICSYVYIFIYLHYLILHKNKHAH